MLNKTVLSIVISCFILLSMSALSVADGTTPSSKVIVYYFRTTQRCPSCIKIENYTKESLEQNFKKSLTAGSVTWNVINIDHDENSHYVNDYRIFTKSIVLSLVKNGKEVKWVNLKSIWQFVPNKTAFQFYIKKEVEKLVSEL